MNKTKSGLLYIAYFVAVTVLFLYYLFPSGTVKRYLSYAFLTLNHDLKITIEDLNPSLPPGLRLNNTDVYHLNTNLFHSRRIKITPGIISLFRSEKTIYFNGDAYEGVFDGNVKYITKPAGKDTRIEGKISDLNIKKIHLIRVLTGRRVSGVLDGKFRCQISKRSGLNIGAELMVSNCTIELLNPILKLEQLHFKNIETVINITNKKFHVKRCDIKGDEINGSLSGTVMLTEPVGKSMLNLSGKIKPDPVFLARLKKEIPAGLLPKKISDKKGIFVRFTGTLNHPEFSLK